MLIKSNKGSIFEDIFIIIITLIVFFALWPAASALINVAVAANTTDPTLNFFFKGIGFIIIFAMFKWILSSPSQNQGGGNV